MGAKKTNTTNTTNDLHALQVAEAVKRMGLLNIMPDVIKAFKKDGTIYYSEYQNRLFNAVLYWLTNEPDYVAKVKDFEKRNNALVYHCQLSHTNIGDMLTLLYVSNNPKNWELDCKDLRNGYAMAYVYNLDDDMCSEAGSVGVRGSMGGVVRTA